MYECTNGSCAPITQSAKKRGAQEHGCTDRRCTEEVEAVWVCAFHSDSAWRAAAHSAHSGGHEGTRVCQPCRSQPLEARGMGCEAMLRPAPQRALDAATPHVQRLDPSSAIPHFRTSNFKSCQVREKAPMFRVTWTDCGVTTVTPLAARRLLPVRWWKNHL